MNLNKNYYKILKLDKNATVKQIKKAYLELAKKYHPDKNDQLQESNQMFQEINEAYTILTSIDKKLYDVMSPHFNVKRNMLDVEIFVTVLSEKQLIKYQAYRPCKKCDQTGFDVRSDFRKCKACNGRGYDDEIGEECVKCIGTGKTYDILCPHCRGKKQILTTLETYIEPYFYKDTCEIVMPNIGHKSVLNNSTGNLIVHLSWPV